MIRLLSFVDLLARIWLSTLCRIAVGCNKFARQSHFLHVKAFKARFLTQHLHCILLFIILERGDTFFAQIAITLLFLAQLEIADFHHQRYPILKDHLQKVNRSFFVGRASRN